MDGRSLKINRFKWEYSEKTKQELLQLRKALHRYAELSGYEEKTARTIRSFLRKYEPDEMIQDIGGFGLAAIFQGGSRGPTIMLRCELDGLPIPETLNLEYSSVNEGVSHKCGHDGHMTILAGLAKTLHNNRLDKGSVVLLFQPAEETGEGAQKVLEDPKFKVISPDYVFALHNMPGFPLGQVIVRKDVFASASKGLVVDLKGATSHAAEPEKGRSPAMAVAQLIQGLSTAPQNFISMHEAAKVTVIHARLGEIAFGTSPGSGTVMVTLRTNSKQVMKALSEQCVSFIRMVASVYNLEVKISWTEEFPVIDNDNDSVQIIEDSANSAGLELNRPLTPFPWSEDFGHFTAGFKGAMFGLGAGVDHPALHHPKYDFPDDLIDIGIKIYAEIIRRLLG